MNYRSPGILSYIAKTSILVLYASFFIVQIFFNFDIANSSDSSTLFSSYKNVPAGYQRSEIKKIHTTKDKKQTVRLNKRFKPKIILDYNPVHIKSPVYC